VLTLLGACRTARDMKPQSSRFFMLHTLLKRHLFTVYTAEVLLVRNRDAFPIDAVKINVNPWRFSLFALPRQSV
jgi:hypothetical protein